MLGWALRFFRQPTQKAREVLHRLGLPTLALDRLFTAQSEVERQSPQDLESYCTPTREAMAQVFGYLAELYERAELRCGLQRVGWHLGGLLYLLDAATDYASDLAKGRFNAFASALGNCNEAQARIQSELDSLALSLSCLPISEKCGALCENLLRQFQGKIRALDSGTREQRGFCDCDVCSGCETGCCDGCCHGADACSACGDGGCHGDCCSCDGCCDVPDCCPDKRPSPPVHEAKMTRETSESLQPESNEDAPGATAGLETPRSEPRRMKLQRSGICHCGCDACFTGCGAGCTDVCTHLCSNSVLEFCCSCCPCPLPDCSTCGGDDWCRCTDRFCDEKQEKPSELPAGDSEALKNWRARLAKSTQAHPENAPVEAPETVEEP